MQNRDISEQLQAQVLTAWEKQAPLQIRGGGSKDFYGRQQQEGESLNTADHQGIINYEPTELVITARAGSRLKDIEATLAENRQMLAFEPPAFGEQATLGGTIACNLSGPRRAYAGAARDFVLGTRVLNGRGEILHFGGEVMKNVAGYDVSRLMTGAMGTLGVLLEVSLKVLPMAETELTLQLQMELAQARQELQHWLSKSLPISASAFHAEQLYVRLSGTANAVQAARQLIGGEPLAQSESFWHSIKEQQHDFFTGGDTSEKNSSDRPLWRLSLASTAGPLAIQGDWFYEWGGALRWLRSDTAGETIFQQARQLDGHASLFRSATQQEQVFQPLPEHLMQLQRRIKQAFDPRQLFNPGRMYQGL